MYKRMLMPTDGSACSEQALKKGLALARQLGAEVTFLYALQDTTLYTPTSAAYQPQVYEGLKATAQEALARAQVLAEEAGVPARAVLVENRHPVDAIHDAEQDADLVVMGTHGRQGFNRFRFGSVAEGALRRSQKPYLTFRQADPVSEKP